MSRAPLRLLSARLPALRPRQYTLRRPVQALLYSTRYSQPGRRTSRNDVDSIVSPAAVSPESNASSSDPYIKDPQIEQEEKRQAQLQRLRYASYGLFCTVLATGVIVYKLLNEMQAEDSRRQGAVQCEASSSSNAQFHGRPVHVIGAGEDKRIVTDDEEHVDLVETGTSSVPYFPRSIYLPPSPAAGVSGASAIPSSAQNPGNIRNDEEYTLVGLGIRSVSFLSIQVYVLGFYVRTADLSTLQARLIHYVNENASTLVPSEKSTLKQSMLDPAKSTEIWEDLLRSGIKTAWRISPTRNTDFAHLRDGWVTGIKRGTQAATAAARSIASGPAETEYDSEAFGEAVKQFKDIFNGWGKAPKGSVITLARDQQGELDILFEDPSKEADQQAVGRVTDARIAKLIWLGYTAGKNVSSEAARAGVADGCLVLASRPVGSAETMVN